MNNPIISPDGDTQDLLNRRKKAKASTAKKNHHPCGHPGHRRGRQSFSSVAGGNHVQSATPQATEAQVYTSTYDVSIDVDDIWRQRHPIRVRPYDGTVTGVYVMVGQEVKKGDLLFSVDDTSQQ
jgi:biotin carboxyl carrier protein